MGYASLRECVVDLERTGQLVRIDREIDPYLEAAEVHRRVCQAGGPALLFTRVKGCQFPMVSNLFGTLARAEFLLRDTLTAVRHLVELKIDPAAFWKGPWRYRDVPRAAWSIRPKWVRRAPILDSQTTLSRLPQLTCWPMDGGPFVTLPVVYTEDVGRPGWRHSNLGMYRVQLAGNEYAPDRQAGLHYQIHRGIGVHHAKAIERGVPFRVNVFVGGPPALTLSAVMPLPEGLPELAFAGAIGGRRVRLVEQLGRLPLFADADFAVVGTVDPEKLLPEGPFGDHLGYYSLAHPFPVLNVEHVYHRRDAIWPFTVVGRPPQEDTSFGRLIHELTGPVIPTVVPGVHAVHAVDAAGVHPLLLAIGSERYVPYAAARKPQELLTCANAILGQGQLSLAKYLLIVAREDDPSLDVHDIRAFFRHLLERIDWRADVHFQTCTTIDTLDYSGTGLNEGSKVVLAAAGPKRRDLPTTLPSGFRLPDGFASPKVVMPGVLVVGSPAVKTEGEAAVRRFCAAYRPDESVNDFPLIMLVDDSDVAARSLDNWLWVTFTRSNPAADIDGVGAFTRQKHWGCEGALVIDARIKPHHAPPVVEDPAVAKRVDALAAPGGPLHGIL
ncbi:MAG TPA: UbiD family decarboxylase [Gemmataceae bacterium]|nr:UbiD family decarboxylase [Gemmataceae bacterium]